MKWISVKDHPPAQFEKCLAGSSLTEEVLIGYVIKSTHGKTGYSCEEQGTGYIALNITHWMPLPEPPKEDT